MTDRITYENHSLGFALEYPSDAFAGNDFLLLTDESDLDLKQQSYVVGKLVTVDGVTFGVAVSVVSRAVDTEQCRAILADVLPTLRVLTAR